MFWSCAGRAACLATGAGMLIVAPAGAAETVTYTYDALGRLTQSSTSGTINNGLVATSTYDAADNRSNYTVTGSPNSSQPVRVVVLPLGGFTIISLGPVAQ